MVSTVGTSTSQYAPRHVFQRKAFYAAGLIWVFYGDGSNMVYRTSVDGVTWSSATTIKALTYAWRFSIWFDGTYVHYVTTTEASGGALSYRRGTPGSDGSITWSAAEQTALAGASGKVYYYPMISVDSGGYPWIGYYRDGGGTDKHYWVTKSSANDGTWSTQSGFPKQMSTLWAVYAGCVIPLNQQKALVIYNKTGAKMYMQAWTGSTWNAEVSTTNNLENEDFHCAVSEGDNVHIVFLEATAHNLMYTKFNYQQNALSTETTFQAAVTNTSAPVLCMAEEGVQYCFWLGSPTAHHVYYKKCEDGTWDTDPTDWVDESTDQITDNRNPTGFYEKLSGIIGLAYETKAGSPYNVRFNFLGSITPSAARPLISPPLICPQLVPQIAIR